MTQRERLDMSHLIPVYGPAWWIKRCEAAGFPTRHTQVQRIAVRWQPRLRAPLPAPSQPTDPARSRLASCFNGTRRAGFEPTANGNPRGNCLRIPPSPRPLPPRWRFPHAAAACRVSSKWRGPDSNRRPTGYEPVELPTAPPLSVRGPDSRGVPPARRRAGQERDDVSGDRLHEKSRTAGVNSTGRCPKRRRSGTRRSCS
jgi:hypothetical protein